MRNLQFRVLATIANFNKKQSYSSLGLNKSIKPAIKAEPAVAVNRTINTKVVRTKKGSNKELSDLKKEFKSANKGKKPVLLVSSKLN